MYPKLTVPEQPNSARHPRSGFVTRASAALLLRLDEIADRLTERIEQAESVYGRTGLVNSQDLRVSNHANLSAILAYLSKDVVLDIAAPRETGRRRAEAGVPLPSVLRAYRIGGAMVWDELLAEASDDSLAQHELLGVAAEIWRLMDEYSQVLTDGYQEAVTDRVRRDARAHDAAMDALLSGQVDGSRLRECARTLGLPVQGEFVVVAAATETAAQDTLPGFDTALSMLGIASSWRLRVRDHVGIVTLTSRFTVERLCGSLTERAGGRIGVSSVFTSLSGTPVALNQAELSCTASHPGSRTVLRYDAALIPVLLAGSPEIARALAATVLEPILALTDHDRDTLLCTLRAWFERDGDVLAIAAQLFCHRNTVRFRMNRVAQLTGRRLSAPSAITEMDLALRAHDMLGDGCTQPADNSAQR